MEKQQPVAIESSLRLQHSAVAIVWCGSAWSTTQPLLHLLGGKGDYNASVINIYSPENKDGT